MYGQFYILTHALTHNEHPETASTNAHSDSSTVKENEIALKISSCRKCCWPRHSNWRCSEHVLASWSHMWRWKSPRVLERTTAKLFSFEPSCKKLPVSCSVQSSVPLEAMFCIKKEPSMAPHRANLHTVIHDYYAKFFPITKELAEQKQLWRYTIDVKIRILRILFFV